MDVRSDIMFKIPASSISTTESSVEFDSINILSNSLPIPAMHSGDIELKKKNPRKPRKKDDNDLRNTSETFYPAQ